MAEPVFVVDDDPDVGAALDALLRSAGYDVHLFQTAAAFLAAVPPERPAVLILDVAMPGISGLELQGRLATRLPELPVLFLTAHGDASRSARAMKEGAFAFFTKPFDGEALLAAVARAMAHATAYGHGPTRA